MKSTSQSGRTSPKVILYMGMALLVLILFWIILLQTDAAHRKEAASRQAKVQSAMDTVEVLNMGVMRWTVMCAYIAAKQDIPMDKAKEMCIPTLPYQMEEPRDRTQQP